MPRRVVVSAVVVSLAVLAFGGVVSAHIDPDPPEAQAGSRIAVGFTVEHGCEGSATVQLDMRLPVGVTDPVTEPIDGWEGSIDLVDDDTIVTFVGGPLDDDVEGTFSVTMTLPPTPDTTIYFPFVQRCEVGEIRWIQIPSEPGDDLDEPAPALALVGPVATAPTTVAVTEPAQPTTTEPTATTEPTVLESPATTESSSTAGEVPDTSEPVPVSTESGDGGSSNTGTIAFIVSIAAVLAIGVFVVYRSRQARAAGTPDPN
jgi:uncharacterized protein YcnI